MEHSNHERLYAIAISWGAYRQRDRAKSFLEGQDPDLLAWCRTVGGRHAVTAALADTNQITINRFFEDAKAALRIDPIRQVWDAYDANPAAGAF